MALKNPSDFFDEEKKESIIDKLVERPELKSFSDAFNVYKENISKFDDLSETLKNIENIQSDIKDFIKKEDLDNAVISYAFLLEETVSKLKDDVKGINEKHLIKIRSNVSGLAEKINNFVEIEAPKYKKSIVESEIKSSNRYEKFKNDTDIVLEDISKYVNDKYGSIEGINKDAISEITKSISKHKIDIEEKTEKNISSLNETLDKVVGDLEQKINLVSDNKDEIFEDLSKKIVEVKKLKRSVNKDLKLYEDHKNIVENKISDLEVEIVRSKSNLKEQNKEFVKVQKNVKTNFNSIREEFKTVVNKLNLDNLEEKNNELSKKVRYLEEVFAKFNEKEFLSEGLLNIPPETDNSDPLTPLNREFVTLDQLQNHYRLFLNRIQQQLATFGGGGETQLKYLDDVVGIATNPAAYDGGYLRYVHSLKKFAFSSPSDGDTWIQGVDGPYTMGRVGIGTSLIQSGDYPGNALVVDGNARFTGIVSIGTSSITLNAETGQIAAGDVEVVSPGGGANFVGVITAGGANFTGNVTIGGTLTYEDVKNVDSIGIITANKDVRVGRNFNVTGLSTFTGITTFSDDVYVGGDLNVVGDIVYDEVSGRNLNVSGVSTVNNLIVGGIASFTSSSHTKLPSGTTAQRPVSAVVGDIRYNTQTNQFEGYKGSSPSWGALGGGGSGTPGGSNTQIQFNDSGSFEGNANLTFDGSKLAVGVDLDVAGNAGIGSLNITGVSTFADQVYFNNPIHLAQTQWMTLGTNKQIKGDGNSLNIMALAGNDIEIDVNAGGGTSGDIILKTDDTTLLTASGDGSVSIGTHFSVSGITTLAGNIFLGEGGNDDINVNGYFISGLVPKSNDTWDLGTTGKYWKNLYISDTVVTNNINASGVATIGNVTVGGATTDLIVEGNARVTGILSVGTGTVVIDETTVKTGTSNLHSVGIEIAGINVLGADTPIGTGATIYDEGGAGFTGVVTATSFDGNLATTNLTGTITNAQLAGSIANDKLANNSVSYGGIELALGASDATPAFDLQHATNYPYTSLTGITTTILGDATPKLGGNLDGNSKSIYGVGVLTATQIADSNGSVGSASSVLSSTGSGLSWVAQSGGGISNIGIQSAGTLVGTATTINFTAGNITVANDIANVSVGSSFAYAGARVYFSTGTPDGTGSYYYVSSGEISTINLDTHSFYNSSNGRYEIPAGVTKVRLRANVWGDSGSGSVANAWQAYKNGSAISLGSGGFFFEVESGSGYTNVGTSGVSGAISVSEGDYIQLAYTVNSTARSWAGTWQLEVLEGSLLGHYFASTNVTNSDNITVQANNTADETVYPIFVDGATGIQGPESDTGFTYNPSSGNLTATQLTGTLQTASQTNITALGTIATGTWNGTAVADAYVASSATWNAKQAALTFGIANTNALKIDDADAADNDYAKLTASGIEGRSYSEVKTDLSLDNVENTALSTWAGTSNITTVGTLGSLNVTGDVSIGGTLTYEDVTNIDSVGIVTARKGVDVGSGYGVYVASGVITATTFDGNLATSNLTGTITNAQLAGSIADGKLASTFLKNVLEDTTPQLGGNLDGNSKDIYGVGIITATSLDIDGDVKLSGELVSKTSSNNKITFSGTTQIGFNAGGYQRLTITNNIIKTASGTRIQIIGSNTGSSILDLGRHSDFDSSGIEMDHADLQMRFRINTTDTFNINENGAVSTGIITATSFSGDGSALTSVSATDSTKLPLSGGTIDGNMEMTGNVFDFAESKQLRFGAGNDFAILHNGNTLLENETTGGNLTLNNKSTSGKIYLNVSDGDNALVATPDGSVEIHYANAKKIETTSTGAVVTGVLTATSFSGDGSNLSGLSGFSPDADENLVAGTDAGDNLDGSAGCFNVFLGACAGNDDTSGHNNVFIGCNAGKLNTGGDLSVFIGRNAGCCANPNGANVVIGALAGQGAAGKLTGWNNTFVGGYAGRCTTSSQSNAFFGRSAGQNNTSGGGNVALGMEAGCCGNGSGHAFNVYIGCGAGQCQNDGKRNILIGCNAELPVLDGSDQIIFTGGYRSPTPMMTWFYGCCSGGCTLTGIGTNYPDTAVGVAVTSKLSVGILSAYQLYGDGSNLTGISGGGFSPDSQENLYSGTGAGNASDADTCYNVAIGYSAGYSNASGDGNVFIGKCAGYCYNDTGLIAIGDQVGASQRTGNYNIYFGKCVASCVACNNTSAFNFGAGFGVLKGVTTGSCNVAIGYEALGGAVTGGSNVAFGRNAGGSGMSGNDNTSIGRCASNSGGSGSDNIVLGCKAALYMSSGSDNIVMGKCSMGGDSITGSYNISFGHVAGKDISSGHSNVFIGKCAGQCATNAPSNVVLGQGAVSGATFTGDENVVAGFFAGCTLAGGNYNVILGSIAGRNVAGGSKNFLGGYAAGDNITSGNYNVIIGSGVDAASATGDNQFIIGCGTSNWICGDSSFNATIAGIATVYSATGIVSATKFCGDGSCLTGISAGGAWKCISSLNFVTDNSCSGCNFSGATDNILAGSCAGKGVTSGDYNVALGYEAGCSITEGGENITIGYYAGKTISTCSGNIMLGTRAGENTNGSHNFFGLYSAGRCNTSGKYNIFFGVAAGKCITTADSSIGIGQDAGMCNAGDHLIAIGDYAAKENEGVENIAIGTCAGKEMTSGTYNIFLGHCAAGSQAITGDSNIAIGMDAGECLTTGTDNTIIGTGAASLGCVTGNQNTIVGAYAGKDLTSGARNLLLGRCAGENVNSGGDNVIGGWLAGECTTSGNYNLLLGYRAGNAMTGNSNVALGPDSALFMQGGNYNIAIGYYALRGEENDANGGCNIGIGCHSGNDLTDGDNNVFIGNAVGCTVTTGCCNVIIGHKHQAASITGNTQFSIGVGSTSWISGDSSYNIKPGAGILDKNGNVGTAASVLTSTGSAIEWKASSGGSSGPDPVIMGMIF